MESLPNTPKLPALQLKSLRVATVQMHHAAGDKPHNLARMHGFVETASKAGVKILVFPEMCVTGYWHVRNLSRREVTDLAEPVPSGPSSRQIREWSLQYQMTIGAGLIEIDDAGHLYNTYVVAMPDDTTRRHRKIQAFEHDCISSGSEYTVFDTPHGCRVGVLICYDNNIIENARITALMGAEILLAPHQTGGCDSRSPGAMGLIDVKLWRNRASDPGALEAEFRGPKGREWLMRWLPSRAHDNGMFLIFSNGVGEDDGEVRTGNAMILDPYGRVIAESTRCDDDMVVANLDMTQREMCTGSRWLKVRRPELYAPLVTPSGQEQTTRKIRFAHREDSEDQTKPA